MDAVAEYLARGGKITKCPTVYVAPVEGAEPIRSGLSGRDQHSTWGRNKSAARGQAASARKRQQSATMQKRNAAAREAKAARLATIVGKLQSGMTPEDIAAEEGCGMSRIRELLREAGINLPRKSQVQPNRLSDEEEARMIHLYTVEGLSLQRTATADGKNWKRVRAVLARNNIEIRPVGWGK